MVGKSKFSISLRSTLSFCFFGFLYWQICSAGDRRVTHRGGGGRLKTLLLLKIIFILLLSGPLRSNDSKLEPLIHLALSAVGGGCLANRKEQLTLGEDPTILSGDSIEGDLASVKQGE